MERRKIRMSHFEIGQWVICVNDPKDFEAEKWPGVPIPIKDEAYQIRGLRSGDWPGGVTLGLVLEELPYPPGYDSRGFRPVVNVPDIAWVHSEQKV